MNKVLLILHKLGILRSGSYKRKGDAKDRPIQAIMDDVYDEKKDLIHKSDFQKNKKKIKPKKDENIKFKPSIKRKVLLWVSYFLAFFIFLLFIFDQGLSIWTIFIVLLWGIYIHYVRRFVKGINYLWKKLISALLIITLLSIIIFGVTTSSIKEWENFSNTSFSTSFEWDEELMNNYNNQDTLVEMGYAGPFYFGNFEGVNEYTKMYTLARNDRVSQISGVMDESIDYLNELEDYTKEYRGLLDWYIFRIVALAPDTKEAFYPFIDESTTVALKQNLSLELLNTLNDELGDVPKDAEEGFLTYMKYVTLINLVDNYSEELEKLNVIFLTIYKILETNNEMFQEINRELDEELDMLSKKASPLLLKLHYNSASLLNEKKLLFTADYYFSKDTLSFLKIESEKLADKLSNYNGENINLDEDGLEMIKTGKIVFDEYIVSLEEYLNSIPGDQLLQESELETSYNVISNVYAFGNPITWFGGKIKSAAKASLDFTKAGADIAWNGVKKAGSVVKSIAEKGVDLTYATAKMTGKVLGTGLDAMGVVMKTGFDGVCNTYYGNDQVFYKKDINKEFERLFDNIEKGTSGSEYFKGAIKLFEGTENLVGNLIEKTVGAGRTKDIVGGVAKLGIGFFTGFAKDTFTILDPTVSKSKTFFSLASLVMTFTGGSQSLFKSSTAAKKLLGEAGKVAGKETVKKSTFEMIKVGLNDKLKAIVSKNALPNLLKKTKNILSKSKERFIKNPKETYKYLKGNIREKVPGTYKGFFDKVDDTGKALGIKDQIITALGMSDEGGIGLLKNLAGNYVDNHIKEQFKVGINKLLLLTANAETTIKISDELKENNKSELEKLSNIKLENNTSDKKTVGDIDTAKSVIKENQIELKRISDKPVKEEVINEEPTNLGNLERKLETEAISTDYIDDGFDDYYDNCIDEDDDGFCDEEEVEVEEIYKGLPTAQDCINQGGTPGGYSEKLGVSCSFWEEMKEDSEWNDNIPTCDCPEGDRDCQLDCFMN